ncbi:hypothetical protein V5M37_13150 [Neobacillus sp. SAB-20_R2A]
MVEKIRPYWPADVPANFTYLQGEKPLFAYLEQHGNERPNDTAYIFYGQEVTWGQLLEYVIALLAIYIKKGLRKAAASPFICKTVRNILLLISPYKNLVERLCH